MNRRAQGLRAWLWQRLSAVYMLAYLIYAGISLVYDPPRSYAEWRGWMADPLAGLATALFFASLLVHAWVGTRDVIIDYVRALAARLTLLTLAGLALAGAGLWVLKTLYSLHGA
jgi:succinate dehydrogenase / fumarate reductase membrane anchor subunit